MSATTPTILENPKIRSRSGGGGGSGKGGGGGGGGSQATVRLRVVVRHLPSLLKEDEFREGMADYVNEETTEWLSWTQGKIPAEFSLPIFIHRYGTTATDCVNHPAATNSLFTPAAI